MPRVIVLMWSLVSALHLAPAGSIADDMADLVLLGGVVHTLDPAQPDAEAVAVRDGRFLAVGSRSEIERHIGPATRVLDATGLVIYPGFVDSHAHMEGLGSVLRLLNLVGTESVERIVDMVRGETRATRAGEWIQGRGWDQNDWKEQSFPTREPLDSAAPENPVWLKRIDGHAGWANSRALEEAGIDERTADPPGGRIHRDASTGRPTGVLVDKAMNLISKIIPKTSRGTRKADLIRAVDACLAVGLTEVHDAGVDAETIDLYRELIDEGRFPFRVYAMVEDSIEVIRQTAFGRGPVLAHGDGRLTVRAVKAYADGALGSRGAALIDDYTDNTGNRGFLMIGEPALTLLARRCAAEGWQLCTHAIGDRANRVVLDAYAAALATHPDPDHRFRIEHAQVIDPEDIPRFAAMGVIAAMQPTHATSDMPWAPERLGQKRLAGAYAWRRLLAGGATIACGSDFPVESHNPVLGIYAAVTRQDLAGNPPGGWLPEERMTREEALRGYTIDACRAAFQEAAKGTIAPGKVADLTVLDRDIMTCDAAEIARARVRWTIVGGAVVYEGE
jgi:predicted amidohydrolase YtcJ